jgi:hypothetical protein
VIEDKEEASKAELFYIHDWDLYENGLNSATGGWDEGKKQQLRERMLTNNPAKTDSHWSRGKKGVFSDETLDKMRLAKLGKPRGTPSDDVKSKMQTSQKNRVRIECIQTNQIFESITDCAKTLQLNRPDIRRVLNGERNHAHGFTFRKV